jgi:TolB-like protein
MLGLAPVLLSVALAAGPPTVAISYFDNNSDDRTMDPLGRGLADMLITDLSNVQSLQLVEREKLNLALDELKLSKSKFIDPKNALALGKGLSAKYLLTGSFAVVADTLRLDARLFDVPAGKVLFSEKVEGKKDEFFALEKELVDLLIKAVDVKLQLSEKTKLRSNATESFDAFTKYAQGLSAKDQGDPAKARELFEAALMADPNYRAAKTATERIGVIAKRQDDAATKQADDLRKTLDPKAKDFAQKVDALLGQLDSTKTDQLQRKIELLTFLVKNDLTPSGSPYFSAVPNVAMELIGRHHEDPVVWDSIPAAYEYVLSRYPTQPGLADRCRLELRSLKGEMETDRVTAQREWDEDREQELKYDPTDWRVALRKNEAGLRNLIKLYASKAKK